MERKLISYMKQYRYLYDRNHKLHRNKDATDRAWIQISASLNISEIDCKKKWKSLRVQYTKLQNFRQDSSLGNGKKFAYEKQMAFLKPHIRKKITCSVFDETSNSNEIYFDYLPNGYYEKEEQNESDVSLFDELDVYEDQIESQDQNIFIENMNMLDEQSKLMTHKKSPDDEAEEQNESEVYLLEELECHEEKKGSKDQSQYIIAENMNILEETSKLSTHRKSSDVKVSDTKNISHRNIENKLDQVLNILRAKKESKVPKDVQNCADLMISVLSDIPSKRRRLNIISDITQILSQIYDADADSE